jgi:hypothetical protein
VIAGGWLRWEEIQHLCKRQTGTAAGQLLGASGDLAKQAE